jgi:uncharacterized protein (DUF1800 family)
MKPTASMALARFGLGARTGDFEQAGNDPARYLKSQIGAPAPLSASLPASQFAIQQYAEWQEARKAAKAADAPPPEEKNPAGLIYHDEAAAWLSHAVSTDTPFHERLAMFWLNHFTVSAEKNAVGLLAGAYLREAIRPHISGKFADMLTAVVKHPAMLEYLDGRNSIGPNSKAGQRKSKGLNENLAREVLELHTLGVGGGYTPADVTSFAKLLTGWSFVSKAGAPDIGAFVFRENAHEPGPISVLDQKWPNTGLAEGEAFLERIAVHPKTARFIAVKLVSHFVSDTPPADTVAAVEAAFLKSGGELTTCYHALLDSPPAWEDKNAKLKSPLEYLISALRGLGAEALPKPMLLALSVMGEPLWKAPSPKGWPDASSAWITSDALKTRLDFASALAAKASLAARRDPLQLGADILGERLTDETTTALSRAADGRQALTLILMSPEFQRR